MNSWLDVKYAWRLLAKSWGYSLMCASVVALSVGAAVWTCELAYSQMYKPLGFPGSERWYSVQIGAKVASTPRPSVDAYTYQELVKQNRSADYLGAFAERALVLSEGQASRILRGAAITPRLLAATQAVPLLGRVFQDSDSAAGATAVAVLSFDAWRNYFAADRAIVGKTIRLDTEPVQVIGVMPKDFFAFEDHEIWVPLQTPPVIQPSASTTLLSPIVALGKDQNLPAILGEMKTAVDRVNRDYPERFDPGRHVALIPALRMYTHSEEPIVVMLSFMAMGVVLLGCVNISMVFLARLLERGRELALRVALGSSRARLMRQCLLETASVVILGLLIGGGLAALGVRWTQEISEFGSRIQGTGRDFNVLELRSVDVLAAVICAAGVWLLSTLVPAWRIARQDAAVTLASGGKGSSVRGGNRSVAFLVGMQVVVSCTVLVICANVVMAVRKEASKPSGIDTAGVTMTTAPTVFDARFAQPSERLRYWDEMSAAIRSRVPGGEAAFATAAPSQPIATPASIEEQEGTAKRGVLTVPLTAVSDGYFKMLGLSLRSGRLFDSTDNASSLAVAVVDEAMARRHWPDGEVLGRRVRLNPSENGPWLTIIGVVSSVAAQPYRPDLGVLYRPLRQAIPAEFRLLVRAPNAGVDYRDALRSAAFSVDRDLPLHNIQTLDDYMRAQSIMATALIPVVAVVALITCLLAASGLFGLISRSVAQRTQEVGIRRALGATVWKATSMFTRQGMLYMVVALVGIAMGIMVLPLLGGAIPNIFDRVVVATTGIVLLMTIVIGLASFLPTRRAVTLEPGDALRYE